MRGHSLLNLAFAGAALLGVAGCGNDVPLYPTYMTDIQPIMTANCIRCHGAGGTLNTDPYIPMITDPNNPQSSYVGTPKNGYFTQLADLGPGKLGLMSYAGPLSKNPTRILMDKALPYMPPPPADALKGYELDVFKRWLDNPLP
jgi:hypothetical protein